MRCWLSPSDWRGGGALITVITRGHRHTGIGEFDFGTDGTTSANVTQAGVAQPCVDSVKQQNDSLDVFVTGSRVELGLHGLNADLLSSDHLGTHCAGPTERDMLAARVLTAVAMPLKVLKRKRISFELHSNLPFHAGPFSGTLKVDAAYSMVRTRGRG